MLSRSRFGKLIGRSRTNVLRRRSSPRCRPILQQLEHRRVLAAEISVTIDDPTELPEDTPNREFTYTLARPVEDSADYLTVKFELAGTATYEADYSVQNDNDERVNTPSRLPEVGPVVATATFEPGKSTAKVEIDPDQDLQGEDDESVILSLLQADEFGSAAGAAVRRANNQDSVYYAVDDQNRLATIDVEIGCVHVLGTIQSLQLVTDIAFTEDGTLFAVSADRLFEVDYENIVAGIVPARDLGEHGVSEANALIDSRDGDFGSHDGDLFAVGSGSLELVLIDIEVVDNMLSIAGVAEVFDIANALGDRLFPTDYRSSGDLDYARDDLVLSASRDAEDFDSLIRIETPNDVGVIDTAPVPAEDPGEDFQNITALAFDGNNMSFGFTGHTLLSVNPFTLNSSRKLELTGRPYDLGIPNFATGTILDDDRVFTSPTISDIANRTLPVNTSTTAIPFTIDDMETAEDLLDVTATSSNETLVPVSGVTLGGAGANRTITITPSIGQSGTSTITVTVTDPEGLFDTETFVVTVTPTITLTGSGETLSLSQPGRELAGVEIIDIRGTGDNTLVLDANVIRTTFAGGTINVISDPGDEVIFDAGWEFAQAFVSDGRLVRQFLQTGATLNLTGPDDFTNPISAFDVNASGETSSLDALLIIRELGRRLFSDGDSVPPGMIRPIDDVQVAGFLFYDVTRDMRITALDALRVINELARQANRNPVRFENELITANQEEDPITSRDDASANTARRQVKARFSTFPRTQGFPASILLPPSDHTATEPADSASLSDTLVDAALTQPDNE